MFIQITIDGPSGVGKSTLAKALSQELGYLNINSGLMFRGLAWYLIKNNIQDKSIPYTLTEIAKHKNFYFENNVWFLDGQAIPEGEMINQSIAKKASEISVVPEIRNYILMLEREAASKNNIVMEGRDIGSAVFPNALLKIYLTASEEIRSNRRYEELKTKGLLNGKTEEDIAEEIRIRDEIDINRDLAPLVKPKDCYTLYSDNKSIGELVETVKGLLSEKLKGLTTV